MNRIENDGKRRYATEFSTKEAQRLMGHTKIQMTSLYAKSSNELKARAVEALDTLTDADPQSAQSMA